MKVVVRDARPADMPEVLELIRELAQFEKEPDAVVISTDTLLNDGFGDHPLFQCFVAEVEGAVSAMALVYPRYSTWKGQVLHLEDLIVTRKMRGLGLGTALLEKVVNYGYEKGVKRISWEVLDWNEAAISFYESKGAKVMRDWDVVQLDEEGIQKFINKR